MNNKICRVSLLFLMIFLTIPFLYSAEKQQNKGSIKGRVVDSQQKPVSFVTISLEEITAGSHSDDDGKYSLTEIQKGSYTMVFSGIGIKTKKTKVEVITGQVTQVQDIVVDNTVELNEVVVAGKSEARKQQEQAYAVTVLDFKKAYNVATPLNKLLNNVSSVRIREDGGVGSDYNFTLNGFSGNQVKFFLDGIPMDNFGSSFNLSNISVNMAERVEIYKGVLPVSLGGDALGGAVNIVSRKDANYLDASYSIGSFNTHRISLNGAYTNEKTGFTIRTNMFYNYSDNNYRVYVPIVKNNEATAPQWVERFHDNYESAGIKLETGIVGKSYADYLLAGIILSENDKDVQTGVTMEKVYGGVKSKSQSAIPTLRYKKDDLFIDGMSFSAYGAYSSVNSFNIDTLARSYNWLGEWVEKSSKGESKYTDSKIKNREWVTNANLNYVIDNHQSVTLNNVFSSLNREIFDKADPQNLSNQIPQNLNKNITGLGWQIKYDRWNATAFGKLYHSKSSTYKSVVSFVGKDSLAYIKDGKTNFGYGAAFTYFILPKLQGKLSYEHAYRLPESTEMFGDGLNQQRNPDLKPESSDNINIGLTYERQIKEHTLFLETSFIYRNTENFILKNIDQTTNPTAGYRNFGKVLTRGIEGGLRYKWKSILHAGANITYQNIIDNQQYEHNTDSYVGSGISENVTYKSKMANIPYLFGHGDLGFSFKDLGLNLSELTLDYSIDYMHEYYLSLPGYGAKSSKKVIPEQLSHNVELGYSMQSGKYSIVLECSNITDEKLYDNYYLQKPGRAFNLKFRYFLR